MNLIAWIYSVMRNRKLWKVIRKYNLLSIATVILSTASGALVVLAILFSSPILGVLAALFLSLMILFAYIDRKKTLLPPIVINIGTHCQVGAVIAAVLTLLATIINVLQTQLR